MESLEKSRTFTDNLSSYWLFPNSSVDEVLVDCLAWLASQSNNFIWQNESLQLKLSPGTDEIPSPHIYGTTNYGDNVDDLWFITYLLRSLTQIVEGLVVKIHDSDGEFLLIEAADYLPKWLNPESSHNRIYLYNGEVHIVPKDNTSVPELPSGVPSISTAVDYVRSYSEVTRASQQIQTAINKRLKRYPEQAFKEIHSTTCYLPVPAAQILTENPQLISAATGAFYLRDPLDLKACQTMNHFPPNNRVNMKVKLTRCLYAQLIQQKFFPPKRSSWNIPSANNPLHKSHDLGMKIAFGLEILCAGVASSSTASSQSTQDIDELRWDNYLASLRKYNYFQGEIEGSIKYKELFIQAREYFIANQELSSTDQENSNSVRKGTTVLQQLQKVSITEEQLRESEKNLTPDDDDSWLYMTYEELDQMLQDYGGAGEDKTSQTFDPSLVTDSMSAFINKQSNILSGAKLPNSEAIKFDDKGFLAAVEKLMNGGDDHTLDSDDSSLDEYESDDSLTETPESTHLLSGGTGQQRSEVKNSQLPKIAKVPPPKLRHSNARSKPSASQQPTQSKGKTAVKNDEPKIEDFMEMMDRELSRTHIGKSFEKHASAKTKPSDTCKQRQPTLAVEEDFTDSDDELDPVDVDLNTVKNLLESYNQQMGLPGPTSNLLESMGVRLPHNADD